MSEVITPPDDVIERVIHEPVIEVTARVAVFEADGFTPFMQTADLVSGNVSIDWNRDERRTLDVAFYNPLSTSAAEGLGYDKIIKVWRGVVTPTGLWEAPLGEFYIDNFNEDHFPRIISMSCRDATKKLLRDKMGRSTTFQAGRSIESLIRTIAVNGGITKFALPSTGKTTTKSHTFERGTPRWTAIKEIAGAHEYEIFFDAAGYLTMERMEDPALTPPRLTIRGGPDGTLAKLSRRRNDDRLYNHIAVTGEGTTPPIYAEAENNDPNSPVGIPRIGRRTYEYVSQFFTNTQQAQDTANKFLAIHSLESYELSLEGRVMPWLDVGRVMRFEDPEPRPGAPDVFMLDTLSIPLRLGRMSMGLKRVVNLG